MDAYHETRFGIVFRQLDFNDWTGEGRWYLYCALGQSNGSTAAGGSRDNGPVSMVTPNSFATPTFESEKGPDPDR
jgi:hypothetical protein